MPVYRLRADTVYGYDHDDWLHTPLVAPEARLDLTTEQIEETLKYFCKSARSHQYFKRFTPRQTESKKEKLAKAMITELST